MLGAGSSPILTRIRSEIQTESPMTIRERDLSGYRLVFRTVNARSNTVFGIILTLSLLWQFSAGAQDIASFGQNSVALLTTQDGKTPTAQTENPGEHQNWAVHVDAVEVFQEQPGFHSPYSGPQS